MTGSGAPTDQAVAERLRAGDVDALGEVYDRYGARAFSIALRVLGDRQRAEDVTQEAFLRVWNNAAAFDAAKGSLRAWLFTIVRNRAVDALRGRSGRQLAELPLLETVSAAGRVADPWKAVADELEAGAVRDAVATLPAEQRQVVELAYYGGYTQQEIAEISRVPLGTVKGRMRLALEKLHSYLSGRGLIDAG